VRRSDPSRPGWQVLLLGGGAAVGKSTAAARIARGVDAVLVPTDMVWLALQAVTNAKEHPELHYFDPSVADLSLGPERLWERHIKTASAVSECLEPVVGSLLRNDGRAVVEGAWITPQFACFRSYDGVEASGRVRAVFIHEPDLAEVLLAMARRRGLSEPTDFQRAIARVCWLHGNWLAQQANTLGVPVVSARPQRDLVRRILAAAPCPDVSDR